jgi:hypothetical protein
MRQNTLSQIDWIQESSPHVDLDTGRIFGLDRIYQETLRGRMRRGHQGMALFCSELFKIEKGSGNQRPLGGVHVGNAQS